MINEYSQQISRQYYFPNYPELEEDCSATRAPKSEKIAVNVEGRTGLDPAKSTIAR